MSASKILVPLIGLTVVRDGALYTPPVNKAFAFTADEVKDFDKLKDRFHREVYREPENEVGKAELQAAEDLRLAEAMLIEDERLAAIDRQRVADEKAAADQKAADEKAANDKAIADKAAADKAAKTPVKAADKNKGAAASTSTDDL